VMSGKGGVGKSCFSVNLAIALAEKGFKVGLMDVDLHGPDIPRMLGLQGMLGANSERKLDPMHYSDNLSAVSIESLMANKDDAVIWRGPVKHGAIRQFIGEVAWGDLDFLIVDAPPGTGDEPLTVAQLIEDAQALIVTTPQEIALADVRKSINFCRTVKMAIVGLVENMSGYTCPHCGRSADIFGAGGGERTALQTGLKLLGSIPFDPRLVACGDEGRSFRQQYADAPANRVFDAIAEAIAGSLRN
ncbi:MAG TPA: Mrp/NBP35 family ATP-binding protein, partial [Desulfosarcina sp.]|nr:Mrp/NBP35 family ATP-binding protein [Desulfosarcina sp.]